MKKILFVIPAILLVLTCFSQTSTDGIAFYDDSQQKTDEGLPFEVNIVALGHTISKSNFTDAQKLSDLNKNFKPSWVRKYKSVEISTIEKGKPRKSIGKNDVLTPEQKELMSKADIGSAIEVNISYMPENTLSNNELKSWNFKFVVNPCADAMFPGGSEQLAQYLKKQAIDNIAAGSFEGIDMTSIFFTIDKSGEISNVNIYEPSENPKIDELLIEAIRTMPQWTPATFSNGQIVKQDFVFRVGNMKNCTVNLLNLRED